MFACGGRNDVPSNISTFTYYKLFTIHKENTRTEN